jgi:hypothetical protein
MENKENGGRRQEGRGGARSLKFLRLWSLKERDTDKRERKGIKK